MALAPPYRPPITALLTDRHLQALDFMESADYQLVKSTFALKRAVHLQSKLEMLSNQQQLKRMYSATAERLHGKILQHDIDLDRKLSKVELAWHNKNIPYFHRYHFVAFLATTYLSSYPRLLHHEEILMSLQQHIYFSILRNIQARENCLRVLQRLVVTMKAEDVHDHLFTIKERAYRVERQTEKDQYQIQGFKAHIKLEMHAVDLGVTRLEQFSEQWKALSRLTINLVQMISKWREYMRSLTHDLKQRRTPLQFYFNEEKYILKAINDNHFISSSFLNSFFRFSAKNDPFLLRALLSAGQDNALEAIFRPEASTWPQLLQALDIMFEEYQRTVKAKKVFDLTKRCEHKLGLSLSTVNLSTLRTVRTLKSLQNREKVASIRVSQAGLKPLLRNKINNPELGRYLDENAIRRIKQEIIKKVRGDLNELKTVRFERQLDQEIKVKVNIASREVTEIEFSPLTIKEEELTSFLTSVANRSCLQSKQANFSFESAVKTLKEAELSYIIQATSALRWLGTVIIVVDRAVHRHKCLRVVYLAFASISEVELLILRSVEFIWKYENAQEVYFAFQTSASLPTLEHNCVVATSRDEMRYYFKRKGVNSRWISNRFPKSLHVEQSLVCSKQKLEVSEQPAGTPGNYDYLLVEILSKHTNSLELQILRDSFRQKERLNNILQVLLILHRHPDLCLNLRTLKGRNISELIRQRSQQDQPVLNASDILKDNSVTTISFQVTMTPCFSMKALRDSQGKNWHRYQVRNTLKCCQLQGVDFWFVPCLERKNIQIVVWSACRAVDSVQLNRMAREGGVSGQYRTVSNLWIQMWEGNAGKDRMDTWRCAELTSIQKQLLVGESLEWFCDLQLQSGIGFRVEKEDIQIGRPFAVALIEKTQGIVIYSQKIV